LPISFASAQLGKYGSDISVGNLVYNIEYVVWMIFALVVVVCFVVAGIMFLTAQGDAKKLETAKASFIWGVAGVAVGIIAYSILYIIGNILIY